MRMLLLLMLTASISFAQETRRTSIIPRPAEDARANSDQVPDAYAITGHFDRVVVLRMKYKTDLLAGLQKMVKQEHIKTGSFFRPLGRFAATRFIRSATGPFPLRTPSKRIQPNRLTW